VYNVAATLAATVPAADGRVGYTEAIVHPALSAPEQTRGWFELSGDGRLIRHQTEPTAETVNIGEENLRISREADGFSNIVPIPSNMQPLFAVLRAIVARDPERAGRLPPGSELDVTNDNSGWTLEIGLAASDSVSRPLVVHGCGEALRSVELRLPDSSTRTYTFEALP
jgi:hypothetical protein